MNTRIANQEKKNSEMAMVAHSSMDDCLIKASTQRRSCRPDHQKTRESDAVITAGVTPAVHCSKLLVASSLLSARKEPS